MTTVSNFKRFGQFKPPIDCKVGEYVTRFDLQKLSGNTLKKGFIDVKLENKLTQETSIFEMVKDKKDVFKRVS